MVESDYSISEAIIIDNGSGVMKAGFNNNEMPEAIFPNITGRSKS